MTHSCSTHHPIFSNSDTAKTFSYSLVVNLGISLEEYCNNHTLWSQVDFLQVQTGDRWYYKVSFSFSFLFHGIRLQNRKQNRSLLLQGKRSGPVLYKGFQSREKNVSVTDSLEKEWFITCCFILHRFQHPKIISHTFNSLPQFEWKTNNRRTEGTFSILLAISVLTDFSLSFTFLKQGVTCP